MKFQLREACKDLQFLNSHVQENAAFHISLVFKFIKCAIFTLGFNFLSHSFLPVNRDKKKQNKQGRLYELLFE